MKDLAEVIDDVLRWLIGGFLSLVLTACADSSERVNWSAVKIADHLRPQMTGDHYSDLEVIKRFVHDNSTHDLSRNFTLDTRNSSELTQALYDHVFNGAEKSVMYCGHRAYAFRAIAINLGFDVRVGNIIGDMDGGPIEGHVLPEILSPEGRYEILDPDFDLYFARGSTRLGLLDLTFANPSEVIACSPQSCGVTESPEGFSIPYLVEKLSEALLLDETMTLYVSPKFTHPELLGEFSAYEIVTEL